MKLDTSGIDPQQLGRFAGEAYALDIVAINFQPKGEASHSYIATDRGGARWLIKTQPAERQAALEGRLRAVHRVQAERGFAQVVAARQNRWGDCASLYREFTVTVYPFLEGENIEPGRQTEAYAGGLAALLGGFHQHSRQLPLSIPPVTFDQPFAAPIQQALAAVTAPGPLANPAQERLRDLMLAQRANILTTLENSRQITTAVRSLDPDWVLTHGDPNWENILVDRSGVFHLLDLDDLALGPPERDLLFYSDRSPERFEHFLRHYLASNPGARLHPEIFAFYHYGWYAQEIAKYTTAILFRRLSPAEAEQAWAELQPYVPLDHAATAAAVRQIARILARIAPA